jgi:hypothetical protein
LLDVALACKVLEARLLPPQETGFVGCVKQRTRIEPEPAGNPEAKLRAR